MIWYKPLKVSDATLEAVDLSQLIDSSYQQKTTTTTTTTKKKGRRPMTQA
jgi:hypothetical protein